MFWEMLRVNVTFTKSWKINCECAVCLLQREHPESVDDNISMDICQVQSFLTYNWECFEFEFGVSNLDGKQVIEYNSEN